MLIITRSLVPLSRCVHTTTTTTYQLLVPRFLKTTAGHFPAAAL